MSKFKIVSNYKLAGDQPKAVDQLMDGIKQNERDQVLLGVTGSGKTFTMANIIERTQRPAIIMAHNKTLAAQLYAEMKSFFPNNAVEYFVSYYDYYQPEAYVSRTDTYIEKDASINEQIDLLRHSATRSLLERKDVIVVASVSCIYGIGSPELYSKMIITLEKGKNYSRKNILENLVALQYKRNDVGFSRGSFRVKGDTLDIFPSHYAERAWRLSFFGDVLEEISEFDPLTGERFTKLEKAIIYANSHYVTPRPTVEQAIKQIKKELKEQIAYLVENNKLVEAQRLEQRTNFDLEMLTESGSCKGIENYSRYLSGSKAGDPPPTLFQYLPDNAILFIDESHVSVPQIGAMYNGDRARKQNLVEFGFRLPSALDNRPLKFEEWDNMRPQTVFVSATPGKYELGLTRGVFIEQVIRPTGLIDPECIIRPVSSQVDDLLMEANKQIKAGGRVLVTTLTKKMAEDLSDYMKDIGIKVSYLHSEVHTLERVEIIQQLRRGEIDVLVGVNLLREGLDIPECSLVAILDADKEGFLRSETSLIQTIGRAARHINGKVILYADIMTNSLQKALAETERRRTIQQEFNLAHNIVPTSIASNFNQTLSNNYNKHNTDNSGFAEEDISHIVNNKQLDKEIAKLKKQMLNAAENFDFEKAAQIRDKIKRLGNISLNI